jgi:hypothetical protein
MSTVTPSRDASVLQAPVQLDAHLRDFTRRHFSRDAGTPFWLDRVRTFSFEPLQEVQAFDDSEKVVEYSRSGRVLLTTLMKEFFVPRFWLKNSLTTVLSGSESCHRHFRGWIPTWKSRTCGRMFI